MNEEWISAHLDDELSPGERLEFDAALADDPRLARTHVEVARVRSVLRDARMDLPPGVLDRMVAAVETADADGPTTSSPVAPIVVFPGRRRVPTFAAVAAALVIIASVVGGLGGSTSLPALGDLVARHEAAAAVVVEGAAMPDEMDDMAPMPMSEAETTAALPMPADYSMEKAFAGHNTIHLVYRTQSGEPVSVFRQEGDADSEVHMWSAPMEGAHVAVVDGSGYVWVVVSDQPHDDMMHDMMDDLPSRSASMAERLRDVADVVAEPFRLWD